MTIELVKLINIKYLTILTVMQVPSKVLLSASDGTSRLMLFSALTWV